MRIAIGITGASGAVYAQRLLGRLRIGGHHLVVTLSRYGSRVWKEELGIGFREWCDGLDWKREGGSLTIENVNDLYADPSWGLKKFDAYLIVPCSVRTMSAIAAGTGDNLITRFADVALKERRPLVLLVRETPFHTLHLERMAALSRAGAVILPASPGFYLKPKTLEDLVDFMVDKVLSYLPQQTV